MFKQKFANDVIKGDLLAYYYYLNQFQKQIQNFDHKIKLGFNDDFTRGVCSSCNIKNQISINEINQGYLIICVEYYYSLY